MSDQPVFLVPHPAHPSDGVESLGVTVARTGAGLQLRYDLHGDIERLAIPADEPGQRRDELWKHTCFELFVRDGTSERYLEFNVSPGGDWAAYAFKGYREDMQNFACEAPRIESVVSDAALTVSVALPSLPQAIASEPLQLGVTAVLEAKSGARSFWALDHIGEAPDFHRSETFTLTLD